MALYKSWFDLIWFWSSCITTKIYAVSFTQWTTTTMYELRSNVNALGRSKLRSYIFAICGSKFTKLRTHTQERFQFATAFSIWRYPVSSRIRYDQVVKLSEIFIKFWCFGPPNFWGVAAKFLTQFYQFGSPLNMCQNIWWRSKQWPQR